MTGKNEKSEASSEENKPLRSGLKLKIDEDPNSLDSVISNLPLTIVPSSAKLSTYSEYSRQESRWVYKIDITNLLKIKFLPQNGCLFTKLIRMSI